jgi:ribosome assembly protein YihI (activator of Der GTPase)
MKLQVFANISKKHTVPIFRAEVDQKGRQGGKSKKRSGKDGGGQ